MPDINVLDEWLHGTRPLLDLLFGHAAGDLAWSAGNTGDEAVGETLVVAVAIFDVFDDNGLFSGVTSGKDDYDFSRFDDGHFVRLRSTTKRVRNMN